jgi:hypothetical protein
MATARRNGPRPVRPRPSLGPTGQAPARPGGIASSGTCGLLSAKVDKSTGLAEITATARRNRPGWPSRVAVLITQLATAEHRDGCTVVNLLKLVVKGRQTAQDE